MIDYERNVLGSLLTDNSLLADSQLVADDFVTKTHRDIFAAIMAVVKQGEVADVVTVSDWLKRNSNRDLFFQCAEIVRETMSTANFASYHRGLKEDGRRRAAQKVVLELQEGLTKDPEQAIDGAIRSLMSLTLETKSHGCNLSEALKDAVEVLSAATDDRGIKTGLERLDGVLGYLRPSDLYILGARPSMGKTAFMLNMALNAGVPVGVISGEQPRDQIATRMIATEGKLSAWDLRRKEMSEENWEKVAKTISALNEKKIFIYDRSSPRIDDVVRQARKWKQQEGIEAIYVDYVQKLKGPPGPRHESVAEVVSTLKDIARELKIPVVGLAQVSRVVDTRDNKRPCMSDLKDSGTIEQEADVIMMLYRDEVYDRETKDVGVAELNVLKNRHGPIGKVKCAWLPEYMKFENLARYEV